MEKMSGPENFKINFREQEKNAFTGYEGKAGKLAKILKAVTEAI